jgi:TfoX/Sxy family transcriptional regulator of competence genes
MSREQVLEKYFNSDIFNTAPIKVEKITTVRVRQSQTSLANTKNDIFNTEKKAQNAESFVKKLFNRKLVYSKIYGSDIFNQTNPTESKINKVRNRNNFSTCFDNMKNNEEYKKNLQSYAKEKRAEKKSFKPDKYLNTETPAERYYKEMYNNNGKIFPENNLKKDLINKEKYAEKKRNLKNDINKINDEISEIKTNPKNSKQIYVRKKNKWTENNSGGYKFINTKISQFDNAKINKQLNLQSNIFQNSENKLEKSEILNYDKIKSRLEEEKNKEYLNNTYHISHNNKNNKSPDLSNNDKLLFGSVHTKWEKSNIDWHNPITELMFGNLKSKEMNSSFGPNGPTPFQRKLNQLADSKNIDTITEKEKNPINNFEKQNVNNDINDIGIHKVEKILEETSDLKEDKKLKIKMNATTSLLNSDNDLEKKIKTLSNYYTNPLKTKKLKKEITAKVGTKYATKDEKNNNSNSDYVLNYATKDQFEKFGENEIKKMFAKYGVHIYDVHKNMFDNGSYNTIQFKVRQNKDEEKIKEKMNEIEKNLSKNYKVKINKEEKKDLKINNKNFVNEPGKKVGVYNENIGNQKEEKKYFKINNNIKRKQSFSRQFQQINYKYKK